MVDSSVSKVWNDVRREVLHEIVCDPDEKLLSVMSIQSQPGSRQWSTGSPWAMNTEGGGGGGELDGGGLLCGGCGWCDGCG